jgi:hypothetical protein
MKKNEMDEACSTYGVEVRTGFWWGKLRERYHLEDRGVDGRIMLESVLRKSARRAWSGLIWLRLEAGSELL